MSAVIKEKASRNESNMLTISKWLDSIGLSRYENLFIENDINIELLNDLDHDLLKEIGVNSAGHRIEILNAARNRIFNAGKNPDVIGGRTLDGDLGYVESTSPKTESIAEYRLLTIMFCDLVDSTALSGKLDAESFRDLILAYQDTCAESIRNNNGYIARYFGDGMLVYFGYPVTKEEDTPNAVRAGLEIVGSIEKLSNRMLAEHGVEIQVRVGIATGSTIVGDIIGEESSQEVAALGETPNIAARLQSLTKPNSVLIEEKTRELIEGQFAMKDLGVKSLKGVEKAISAYWVKDELDFSTRFNRSLEKGLTPFVGRQKELETLHDWLRSGRDCVRLFNISGDAGIGKSRLLHEFRCSADIIKTVFLRGHCASESQSTPYLPFIEVVRNACRIPYGDDAEIETNLCAGLDFLGIAKSDTMFYILHFLGRVQPELAVLDSEILGQRIQNALKKILVARCLLSHVVLVIEDTHWIDTASERLLIWALSSIDIKNLSIIITSRPEYQPAWLTDPRYKDKVEIMRLAPLSNANTFALVKHRLGGKVGDRISIDKVIERVDGNPMFAEEITHHLFLAHDKDGLPASIESVLMGRVSVLDESSREVLQTASIIGRQFSVALVSDVSSNTNDIRSSVSVLEAHELIFGENEEDLYRFKHALVRDAVYRSILRSRRRELHGHLAQCLEARYQGRLEQVADALADQYSQTSRTDKAVFYLGMAGTKSLELYSLDTAESRFTKILELLNNDPMAAEDSFLADVILKLCRIYYYQYAFRDIIAMVERYLPRIELLGDSRRLARFLFEAGYAYTFSGDWSIGLPLLKRSLKIGETSYNDEAIGYACMGLTWYHLFWSTSDINASSNELIKCADRGIECGERTGDTWLISKCLFAKSNFHSMGGRYRESMIINSELLRLSAVTSDPRPRGLALVMNAFVHASRWEYEKAKAIADEAAQTSISPIDRQLGKLGGAWGLMMSGKPDQAIGVYDQDIERMRRNEFRIALYQSAELQFGFCQILNGEIAAGVKYIDTKIKEYDRLGMIYANAYGHFALGQFYYRMVTDEEKPGLEVIRRNLWFLVRTTPFAKRLARRHLAQAVDSLLRLNNVGHVAESLFMLGHIEVKMGRNKKASEYFSKARNLALEADAPLIIERISQLDKLNPE